MVWWPLPRSVRKALKKRMTPVPLSVANARRTQLSIAYCLFAFVLLNYTAVQFNKIITGREGPDHPISLSGILIHPKRFMDDGVKAVRMKGPLQSEEIEMIHNSESNSKTE